MASMNKSTLEKLSEDFTPVKTLLFFLLFTAVSLLVIFVFIVPSIKSYKNVKTEYFRYEMSVNRTKDMLKSKEEELHKLTKNNRRILNSLIAHFNENRFIEYADNFFRDVKLSKLKNITNKEGFSVYELNVTSSIKSPSNFYNFLNGLSRYENIIKADFPITLQAQGKNIKSSFKIKVYNAK